MGKRKNFWKSRLHSSLLKLLSVCETDTLLFVCLILGAIFLAVVDITYRLENTTYSSDVREYKDWYTRVNHEKIAVENISSYANIYYVYNILPSNLNADAILFETTHQNVEVLVEGKTIYDFEGGTDSYFTKSLGRAYHIVNLDNSYADKQITIRLESQYDLKDRIFFDVYMGQPQQLVSYVIRKDFSDIIMSLLLLILGILFTVISVFFSKRISTRQSLHIGILAILFSIWSILQTGVLLLIFDNKTTFMFMEYMVFLILPISMVINIKELFNLKKDIGLKLFLVIYGTNFIASVSLQMLKIKDFIETSWVSHVLIIVGIIYILYLIHIKLRTLSKEETSINITLLSTFVLAAGLLDLFAFYYFDQKECSRFTRISLLAFISYMFISYVQEYINKSGEYAEAKIMAKLAYKDIMTGLFNRTAYTKDIAEYEKQLCLTPKGLNLIYVIFDLNNLKEMNDFHGHCTGDRYIATTGQIIKKAFEKVGKCYRIGGDEFAVIMQDKNMEDYCEAILKLKQLMELENKTKDLEISLAFGYAVFEEGKFASLKELIDKADKNMYENKNIYKENKLCEEM